MKENKVKNNKINSPKPIRKKFSQKEIKYLFSPTATQKTIELCEQMITNKQMREQTIAFIKAVDGKKIRNTSGV